MKNTLHEVEQDGTVTPPPAPNFDIGCFYKLEYYQKTTNARGVETYFIYFKKPMSDRERLAFCTDLCERNMWRMIRISPAVHIVE